MKLVNGEACIQGITMESLVKKHGAPLYIYDSSKISSQINRLKDAFNNVPLKIKYAVKALSNISILKLMKKEGVGVDCVSLNEVQLAIKAGFSPDEVLFTPNSISFEEIEQAVELGVFINIDNISILEQFGHKYGDSKECCVRFNPHVMAGGNSKISTGHIDSKFGISVYQMRHVLKIVKNFNMKISGVHVHTGSDILSNEVFLQVADIIFDVARNFEDLSFIDFGSGFKVPYKDGDITTDIEGLAKDLTTRFKEFCKDYGRELEMWFEPGKFLVSEAGHFLVKVNTIKTTPASTFVGVDSGMNHLARPMMYGAYHHISNISNPTGKERIYSVVGYICETDTFGQDRRISEVREGDTLAIHNAGAYCYSMSSQYNSRPRPAEILIHNEKDLLIRKAEIFDDLIIHQVEVEL